MKATRSIAFLLLTYTSLMTSGASAQIADPAQANDRLSHIEHDLQIMQRQISRDGVPAGAADAGSAPVSGSAQLEVRLSAIEDQLRELRGKVEESDNRTRKLTEDFTKFHKDADFRFNELSAKPGATMASAPTPIAANAPFASPAKSAGTDAGDVSDTPAPAPVAAAATAPRVKADGGGAKETNFSSPRELYNYAFRLLNQTQYEEAATSFDSFTKKYPKDPLVGNAFYWEGETYYIRRDYVNSADFFRQGFEAMPEGPKAADNLLKLAMSLNALSRDKEACLVLQQIVSKYKKTSSSVADKAESEQKRINCHKS